MQLGVKHTIRALAINGAQSKQVTGHPDQTTCWPSNFSLQFNELLIKQLTERGLQEEPHGPQGLAAPNPSRSHDQPAQRYAQPSPLPGTFPCTSVHCKGLCSCHWLPSWEGVMSYFFGSQLGPRLMSITKSLLQGDKQGCTALSMNHNSTS